MLAADAAGTEAVATYVADIREALKVEVCSCVEQLLALHLSPEVVQHLTELGTSQLSKVREENKVLRAQFGIASEEVELLVDGHGSGAGAKDGSASSSTEDTPETPPPARRVPMSEAAMGFRQNLSNRYSFSLPTRSNGAAGSRRTRLTDIWQGTVSLNTVSNLEPTGIVAMVVKHEAFDIFFNVVILLNCASLGFTAHGQVVDDYSEGARTFLEVCEQVFTALFTIELSMRWWVFGYRAFFPWPRKNITNFLDAILVVTTGVIPSYVMPFLALVLGWRGDSDALQVFTIMRAARLLRLVRVVQRAAFFREAWLLLRGLSDSVRTLWWTCVVIFLITYIFAVFGLVLISRELKKDLDVATDPAEIEILKTLLDSVGGLDLLMARLIQVLTMDSWNNSLMRPINNYVPQSWVYFYSYIALAVFVLMNLVTAIIVDNAVATSRNDEEQAIQAKDRAKAEELSELELLFAMMDTDGSGALSWDEFKAAFRDPNVAKKWKLLDFGPQDCREVFQLLDDGSGEIPTREFFDGLARMKGSARSKDLYRVARSQEKLLTMMAELQKEREEGATYANAVVVRPVLPLQAKQVRPPQTSSAAKPPKQPVREQPDTDSSTETTLSEDGPQPSFKYSHGYVTPGCTMRGETSIEI